MRMTIEVMERKWRKRNSHCWWDCAMAALETVWQSLNTYKTAQKCDSWVFTQEKWKHRSKEDLHMNHHRSFICTCPTEATTQMSINKWMDRHCSISRQWKDTDNKRINMHVSKKFWVKENKFKKERVREHPGHIPVLPLGARKELLAQFFFSSSYDLMHPLSSSLCWACLCSLTAWGKSKCEWYCFSCVHCFIKTAF